MATSKNFKTKSISIKKWFDFVDYSLGRQL